VQGLTFRRKRKRRAWRHANRKERSVKTNIITVLGLVLQIAFVSVIAFVLVWFFGQRVHNVGDAMEPVLKNGDTVMVNRLIYNASRPKRGDIIVFMPNGNESTYYLVKRIVGLPGETVQIVDGSLHVNEEKLVADNFRTSAIEYAGIAAEPLQLGDAEYFVLGDNHSSSNN